MDERQTRQETSLRDFLDVVFRRKRIILSIFVLSILFVVFMDARKPEVWESSARVLAPRRAVERAVAEHSHPGLGRGSGVGDPNHSSPTTYSDARV
jgi:uncharacterized protein involved in exopolysaccharide biosynthesis